MEDNKFLTTHYNITNGKVIIDEKTFIKNYDEAFFRFAGFKSSNNSLKSLVHSNDTHSFDLFIGDLLNQKSTSAILKLQRTDREYRSVLMIYSNKFINIDDVTTLYVIELVDILNSFFEFKTCNDENIVFKHLLELNHRDYFEYNCQTNMFSIYCLQNMQKINLLELSLEELHTTVMNSSYISSRDVNTFMSFYTSIKNNDINFSCTINDYRIFSNDFPNTSIQLTTTNVTFDLENHKIIGIISSTDQTQLNNIINNSFYYDRMTGLVDKNSSLRYAKTCIEHATYKQLFLIILDLDDFKLLNDTYGHMFGDEVIKKVSTLLKNIVGTRGITARFGGDEFFIVMHDLGSEGDLRAVLTTIFSQLRWLIKDRIDNFELHCSIGISEFPRNGTNFDELFKKADKGLYIAKQKGKARYIIYLEEKHGDVLFTTDKHIEHILATTPETTGINLEQSRKNSFERTKDIIQHLFSCNKENISIALDTILHEFKLDGISVFSGYDLKRTIFWGNYKTPLPDVHYMFIPNVLNRFNYSDGDAFMENNVASNGFYIPELHQFLISYNITATIQCIIGNKENIKGLVTFDLISGTREWTNDETNSFILITQVIAHVFDII